MILVGDFFFLRPETIAENDDIISVELPSFNFRWFDGCNHHRSNCQNTKYPHPLKIVFFFILWILGQFSKHTTCEKNRLSTCHNKTDIAVGNSLVKANCFALHFFKVCTCSTRVTKWWKNGFSKILFNPSRQTQGVNLISREISTSSFNLVFFAHYLGSFRFGFGPEFQWKKENTAK